MFSAQGSFLKGWMFRRVGGDPAQVDVLGAHAICGAKDRAGIMCAANVIQQHVDLPFGMNAAILRPTVLEGFCRTGHR